MSLMLACTDEKQIFEVPKRMDYTIEFPQAVDAYPRERFPEVVRISPEAFSADGLRKNPGVYEGNFTYVTMPSGEEGGQVDWSHPLRQSSADEY